MTTVYLRVGVLVVVVVAVVNSLSRARFCDSSAVARGSTSTPPQSAAPPPLFSHPDTNICSKAASTQENLAIATIRQSRSHQSLASLTRWFLRSPAEEIRLFLPVASFWKAEEIFPFTPRQVRIADLQSRGRVTFLMYHSPATYFLQKGAQRGFEYDLARAFAEQLGVELEVRTPPPGTDLLTLFTEGEGDIIAGLETTEGAALGPVEISLSYLEMAAEVITRKDKSAPQNLEELAGQPVMVQPGSAYDYQLQLAARTLSLPPMLPLSPGSEATEEALAAVAEGKAAATVMMAPFSELAHTLYPNQLRTAWTLPQPIRLVWAVREGHSELLHAVNGYLDRAGRSGLKKMLLEKYYINPSYLRSQSYVKEGTLTETKRLSRYDHLIAQHAEEAGFDWRLVAALIFEESRFDHDRVSGAGAYGLMQLMPFTARLVGAKNYQEPHTNIEAGVKYLRSLYRNFPYGRPEDRLALALASYVIGPGHVEDAQRMARVFGYDPHCWADSMELMLPFLENPKYYRKSLFGYAQGREAVRYVDAILKRYALYSLYIDRALPPVKTRTTLEPQAASAAG